MGTLPPASVRPALAALLVALALSGCSASAPATPHPTPTPASGPSSPAQVCTSLVSYWAKETLKGTYWSGLDWEQKGLSNQQYEIHEEAVAAGRTEERTAGRDKALELIDQLVARRCAAADGATWSSENWRPPT
ncbi:MULTISPECIES: hypothetical protein [Streptomyces]|uniref:hypothetical protein n=1 Tax=Streptomyces TaxID=1883 RepID=UPI000563260C|nr:MULTISPECIES: hypothetical protein [Streptomyces]AKL69915.1 hypothetical protein M444_10135 [Streptomyces sp. Mg1]WBY19702.1 hypothetical protein PET44_08755 [Streptomyces goshikiensis]WSR98483.1 hypothetical protein OG224_10665 [Streptomyces goshikiensis]WSY00481.1 hypothetical protein OG590_26470 [Streptomyces goshikiensis]